MPDCSLQFDLQKAGFQFWWISILGGTFTFAGVLIFFIGQKIKGWPPIRLSFVRVSSLAFAIAWLSIAGCESVYSYSDYRRTLNLYEDGRLPIAEGMVYNFSPYDPSIRASTESFEIDGKKFSISPNTFEAGYHLISAQGSPLKEGVFARIVYNGDQIVRLETCSTAQTLQN